MSLATKHAPAAWLGLAVRSESGEPHEWPFIGSVILARADRMEARWPNTVHEVIVQPLQFSAFNATYGDPDDKYAQLAAKYPADQLAAAQACAAWLLAVPAASRPLSKRVCWFFSPRSMKPAGKAPGWAVAMRYVLAPGVNPWRFIFCEEA